MAVDSLFDRAAGFVEGLRHRQQETLPEEYIRQTFTCAGCRNTFAVSDMEMVHPSNGFGTCRNCFRFLWNAGKEKIAQMSRDAARRAGPRRAQAGNHQAPPQQPPPGKMPWEVLGVAQDASVAEIKKAYKKLAMMWHPDRVPPGAPSDQRIHARAMFEEITRAKDVMLKVRQPPQ